MRYLKILMILTISICYFWWGVPTHPDLEKWLQAIFFTFFGWLLIFASINEVSIWLPDLIFLLLIFYQILMKMLESEEK